MGLTDGFNEEELAEWDRFVSHYRERTLKDMVASDVMISSVTPGDLLDPEFCLQLGAMIVLDKPIIAVVHPDAVIPPKLQLVADAIVAVDVDLEEGRRQLAVALDRFTNRKENDEQEDPL